MILRFLKPQEGLKRFYVLHQLDEKEAIEICKRHYNLSRNSHRKNEYKNSDISNIEYNNKAFYSFLAIRALYKLTKNKIFRGLNFSIDDNQYDFIDEDKTFGIKTDVIYHDDNDNVLSKFERIKRITNKVDTSIYFCFVFSKHYVDDFDEKNIIKDINEIKNRYKIGNDEYDYMYFYIFGKIYELTPSNELYIYLLPFSSRDRAGVINQIKQYELT